MITTHTVRYFSGARASGKSSNSFQKSAETHVQVPCIIVQHLMKLQILKNLMYSAYGGHTHTPQGEREAGSRLKDGTWFTVTLLPIENILICSTVPHSLIKLTNLWQQERLCMDVLCINELPMETLSFSNDFRNTCALEGKEREKERERERERERDHTVFLREPSHSLLCPWCASQPPASAALVGTWCGTALVQRSRSAYSHHCIHKNFG